MDLEQQRREIEAEKKSIEIFKKRFEAFRILYDTVFKIEGLDEEEIYRVLCKNLLKISDANITIIFSFDDISRAIELRSAIFSKTKADDDTGKGIYSQEFSFIKELTETKIEELLENRLVKSSLDDDCVSNFTQDNQIKSLTVWRLSIVRSDELLAVAFIFIDKDRNLPMQDMIDTYTNVSGTILQRIRAVNKLQDTEEWLSVTLQSIGDAVITTNEDGYISFINSKAEELTGWSADEAKGWPANRVFKIVNELNNKPCKSPIEQVLKTSKTIELSNHTALVRKDGSLVPIEDSAAPIVNRAGRIIGVVLVFHDISLLKLSEQRYRESNNFMNMIIENLPNTLYVKEADELRYVRINKAGEKQLGFSRKEIIGKTDSEIFPNKVADEIAINEEAALLSKGLVEADEELSWKDNHKRKTLHSKKIPLLDENQKPEFLIGISEDITEKRKAIAAIKRAHSELNQILDAASALCVIDLDYNIIQVNRHFCRQFDLPEEEVLGRKCHELWSSNCKNDSCPILQIENGGKYCTCEKDLILDNGKIKTVIISSYPYKDVTGNLIGIVESYMDITERKNTENALKRSEKNLDEIFEFSPVGMMVLDAEGKITNINLKFKKLFGYNKEDIPNIEEWLINAFPNKKYRKIIKKTYLEDLEKAAFDNSETISREYMVECKNGSQKEAIISVKPGKDKVLITFVDITRLKKIKKELIESEKTYRFLAENSVDVIWQLDLKLRFTYVSPSVSNITGYEVNEWIGSSLSDHTTTKEFFRMARKAIKAKKNYKSTESLVFEGEMLKKDGTAFPVEISAKLIFNENGLPIGFQGSTRDTSERKKSDKKLRDIQDRLNLIIKSSNDAPWDWNIIDNEIYYAPQWWTQLGYEQDELPADYDLWQRLMCKEDRERVNNSFKKELDGDTDSYEIEFRLKHKDGHYVPVLSRGLITRDESGKAIRVTGTNMDLTKIKQSQQELRKSEERFNLAMSSTNDGLWDWNVITNEVYYSPSWKSMLGYHYNELPNNFSTLANLMKPADRDRKWKILEQILAGEKDKFEIEYKMQHKDGYWIDILSRGEGIFDTNGRATRVIGTHVDVSRLKKAERALAKSEEKYRSLFEDSNDMIFIANPNGQFIDVNRAGIELLGYDDLEEIKGINFKDIITDKNKRIKYKKQMLAKGYVKDMHFSFRCKNGKIIEVVESSTSLKNDSGEIIAFRGIIRDVTQQIQDQKLLKKIINELDNANKQLKITQRSLIRQEKRASIGQLSAGIAHEINNPLGFVSSNFNTLKKYVDKMIKFVDDSQIEISTLGDDFSIEELQGIFLENRKKAKLDFILEDLGDIFDECNEGFERIKSIVNNLKSFARVDNEDNMSEIDVNEIIESTLVVAKNEIKYVAKVEKDLESRKLIKCFKGELSQVFLNLVVNAAHAIDDSDTKNGIVKIKSRDIDNKVYISIEDNGPGIKEKNLNRIFDPFFTTKEQGKGTGLGLYISYDIIVNKHKGQLEASNKENGGAIFEITLPE